MKIRSLRDPVAFIIFALSIVIFIRTAWISDDAMITFRSVLNFTHGYGPVFNIGERVQGFTHPLWFLFLSLGTWATSSIYYFTFFSTIAISVIVVIMLIGWFDKNNAQHWGLLLSLILCKSFIDYSTSGLENPLSHVMIIGGFLFGFKFLESKKNNYALLSLVTLFSTYLCRPDLILLVLPFCIFVFSKLETKEVRWRVLFLAMLPSLLWTLFSFVYYGFPFPNTAYAKLGSHISKFELIWQGLIYLRDTLQHDPLSILVILFGIVTSFRSSRWQTKAIGIGMNTYLAYIVWIGGDFMSGRFMTAPFVASLVVLGSVRFTDRIRISQVVIIAMAGMFNLGSTVMSGKQYDMKHVISQTGIVDERAYWFQQNGMLSTLDYVFSQPPWKPAEKTIWRTCEELGENGLSLGPSTYLIDLCGLTDPLLARFPSYNFGGKWRVGHFYRQVPTNYELAISQNNPDLLTDTWVADYWKKLRIVTKGPIFSEERFKKILELNFGFQKKPDFTMYANERVPSRILPLTYVQGAGKKVVQDQSVNGFYNSIQIDLAKPKSIRNIDISIIDSSNRVVMKYEKDGIYYPMADIELKPFVLNELQFKLEKATPPTMHIRIEPDMNLEKSVNRTGLGHLRINTF